MSYLRLKANQIHLGLILFDVIYLTIIKVEIQHIDSVKLHYVSPLVFHVIKISFK